MDDSSASAVDSIGPEQEAQRLAIEGIYPLSPLQQGLLFHRLYEPDSEMYFEQLSVGLRNLDVEAFEEAWRHVINRHPVLRSSIIWEEMPRPLQIVRRDVDFRLERHDWRQMSPELEQSRVDTFLRQDRLRGFDLDQAPLMRVALIDLSGGRYRFIWGFHHIVMDGWSLSIVMGEVLRAYQALCRGQRPRFGHTPRYEQFIAWLDRQDTSQTEAYWRNYLKGFTAATPLALRNSQAVSGEAQAHEEQQLCLSAALTKSLQQLAGLHHLTLNTIVQGIWALLLSRYSGVSDVVFGVTVSGRPPELPDIEQMVGLFINTLPLRVRVEPQLPVMVWLQQLQAQQQQQQPYHWTPLADIQRWSEVAAGQPLFENFLVFENFPVDATLRGSDEVLEVDDVKTFRQTNYPLTVFCEPGESLSIGIAYDTGQFDAAAIGQLLKHWQVLLDGISLRPQQLLRDLPLLSAGEQQKLIVEWNSLEVDYPRDQGIHELFEAQVERTPDAVAVVCGQEQLTYAQLNAQANRLANYLCTLGVGPESRVGLCLERSPEMIVSLMATLKAGGAYVPLDPSYPADRLAFVVEDAGVGVVLTHSWLQEMLPHQSARLVCLDADEPAMAHCSEQNVSAPVAPQNLAYVIYTSGSTGRPKGVMVQHRSVLNLWCSLKHTIYGDRAGEPLRVSLNAPLSFDSSVSQLVLLLGGHCLHILSEASRRDPADLVQQLHEQAIDVLDCTPSHLGLLVAAGLLEAPTAGCPRFLLVGGELLSDSLWQRLSQTSEMDSFNMYGPTECTVDAIAGVIREVAGGAIIGRPLPNTRAYVLNQDVSPVPVGIPGELCIAGAGLSRGYQGDPAQTVERFIPDPFSEIPGARMYRTGDLVRWRVDQSLEFVGRIDDQVKVRGYRIEPGEIEAVISAHAGVSQCVVIARPDGSGAKRLVAYVVMNSEPSTSPSELRSYLQAKLPDYMLPASFVVLDQMPLTPNDKVNREALPAPDSVRPVLSQQYVMPQTEIEQQLAAIWCEVLGLDRVGVYDNFFELGGDSILSIQIVSRANQAGLQLTVKQVFQHQTIFGLARVPQTGSPIQAEQGWVEGEIPLTPIQHWFLEAELADAHHFNQSMLLGVNRRVRPAQLDQALRALLKQHDGLRVRFVREPSGWRQWHAVVDTEQGLLEEVDLSDLNATACLEALGGEGQRLQSSLSLSEGPLLRAALFDLGAERGLRLLLVIHHLVVDGVSWRILLDHLQSACEQLIAGREIELGPKSTSFRQWSIRLHEHVQAGALDSQLPYWIDLAATSSAALPVDYQRGPNTIEHLDEVTVSLDEARTRALLQQVGRAYRTEINDLLLAALVQTMTRWTGDTALWIDLEGHGREDLLEAVNLSQTVGWFTSIYPVRLEADGADDPRRLLMSVKEQLRSIPEHGIGYGLLRFLSQAAALRDQLRMVCPPQVAFNYLGQFDQTLPSGALFTFASEAAGQTQSARSQADHLLTINSVVVDGRLRISWAFSTNRHRRETIEKIAQQYRESLEGLIEHCLSPSARGYTPSDFPLAELDQPTLNWLLEDQSDIEGLYRLSPLQAGLLFHYLYAPDSEMYFEQTSFEIRHSLAVDAFEQAWRQIIARHTVLRTSIVWEGLPHPLQCVHRARDFQLERHDWREVSLEQARSQLSEFLQQERTRGFDLSQAPLIRVSLIDLPENRQHIVISFHHIIMDGWSVARVFGEVLTAYQMLRRGQSANFDPVPPYERFIEWLGKQDRSEAESFWRKYLQGFTAATPLGLRKALTSPSGGAGEYGAEDFCPSVALTAALQQFARSRHVTLNTVVQGAWGLLLSRYSDVSDVVFGVTVAGRPPELPGIEKMVGLFINTLPLRLQVDPEKPVLDWLRELQEQQQELRRYDWTSLVDVQGWSEVAPGQPLFESQMGFENYPIEESLRQSDLPVEIENTQLFTQTNYPLSLVIIPGESLLLRFYYDAQQFEVIGIRQILAHLEVLLTSIAADVPGRCVAELPQLSASERHRLLVEWNVTEADYPQDQCIHEWFESQVERTPDAVAVVFGEDQLSYAGLDARANQLAHRLRTLGVGPDVRVGICLERSLEMVVGLFGILKAGGAYVPLDPGYPQERLHFMMQDSRVAVLLTQSAVRQRLPDNLSKVLCLDTDWEAMSAFPETNPKISIDADNLAYVIYTSGSTGMPKGAMNAHRGVCNRLLWMQQTYQLVSDDRVLQKTPFSFDVSVWEFFWPLLAGARLVMAQPELHKDGNYLVEVIGEQAITTMHFVPSMLQAFLQQDVSTCQTVRRVICSGEALPFELQQRFFKQLSCELHNLYGPTEAAVDVTFWPCQRQAERGPVPIGRPIANVQMYILDARLNVVPTGGAGELYIAGVALGRGYLGRSALTAERFVANPFGASGSRMYRTGDLARWRLDGSIEFLGRVDHQVKVRGFRIELGEVESALESHSAVRQSVVVVREDCPGDQRLVAYLATDTSDIDPGTDLAEEQISTSSQANNPLRDRQGRQLALALRSYLQAKLPEYMIPSSFVMLESLPLTPNGKVDRKVLPAPDRASRATTEAFVPPSSAMEEMLAELWCEVLGIERLGVNDNFFELGGHSLLATQLLSRIRTTFGVQLPMHEVFDAPTVAGHAQRLAANHNNPEQLEKIARAWLRLRSMTEEERASFLAERQSGRKKESVARQIP